MTTAATSGALPPAPDAAPDARRPRSVRARVLRERVILGLLIACGAFTVLTTVAIIAVLARETFNFFTHEMTDIQGDAVTVTPGDFFGDLHWSPIAEGNRRFGIWPLITGTAQVTVIAMAFALPLGLVTAIWLSEYASARLRAIVKPVLEIIAGVPTVVFGFFALTVITPLLRFDFLQVAARNPATGEAVLAADGTPILVPWNPFDVGVYNALAAGLAVGIMTLPIVTSLSEDALRAVPRALREGAYGLGSSRFEVATKVVVPSALSGIVAAFLLAIARTVGETMIVAMAAGSLPPALDKNLGEALQVNTDTQTMTGYMVQIFLGDIEHGGVEYLSCYTVAFTLFVITLGLTLLGNVIRKRFQQQYD